VQARGSPHPFSDISPKDGSLPHTVNHGSGLVLGPGKTLGAETCGNRLAELGHVFFHSSWLAAPAGQPDKPIMDKSPAAHKALAPKTSIKIPSSTIFGTHQQKLGNSPPSQGQKSNSKMLK
jgi:hypothetical protein